MIVVLRTNRRIYQNPMLWLKALLFFLLSPGVLLTLPPSSGGIWMSRQTSLAAAAVHAVVFVVVMRLAWNWMYRGRFELFADMQLGPVDPHPEIPKMKACFDNVDCPGGKGQRCNPVTLTCYDEVVIPSSIQQ